jgi:DNA-binding transcriptional LysR family regulator
MDRLAALEMFVRVVDTGSFSAVARNQEIGQPAVSKAVVQLEEWLGVSLLMRSTRSLVPTEAGRIFYEHAKRTIEEAHEAVLAARGSACGLSGKLRVSCRGFPFGKYLTPDPKRNRSCGQGYRRRDVYS